MKVNYFKLMAVVFTAVFFVSGSVQAQESVVVRKESGEIRWVDTKLGILHLNKEMSDGEIEIVEYRINQNETRVTDPTDKKFLTVANLYPGQFVIIDVVDGKEEKIVQKITTEPRTSANYQETYGKIETIDATAGTLALMGRTSDEEGEDNLSYYVFDPKNIIVTQSPDRKPVVLVLKPGDVVRVESVTKDGEQWARAITLYSPRVTSTTTTTTVTTTQ